MAGPSSAPGPGSDTSSAYNQVLTTLLGHQHIFISLPTSPHKPLIPSQEIASLSLHPVIESLLHILNGDLPSAHFLCRHAEVKPKWESMYVHGILHRVEGDLDNARAWYGDVKDSEAFVSVWSEANDGDSNGEVLEITNQRWGAFLDGLEFYRDRTRKRDGDSDYHHVENWKAEEERLRETSLWEIKKLLGRCEDKFGVREVQDASDEFLGKVESGDAELAKQAESMVTGGEGWRKF
jgi:hypothetical protein